MYGSRDVVILNTVSEGSTSCAATEVAVRRIRRVGSEYEVMYRGKRIIGSEDSKIEMGVPGENLWWLDSFLPLLRIFCRRSFYFHRLGVRRTDVFRHNLEL